jgi:hypothetical protein
MLRPSLNNKLSFRLVDLTISFAIYQVANKLRIYCIATCIENGTTARNSGAIVPSSPTTTSLWVTSWSSGTFPIINVFQLLRFDVPYTMQVFHTPSSSHSQPNELNGTHGGSSAHSNHPNDGDGVA